jgi:enterochelin esterase family protein
VRLGHDAFNDDLVKVVLPYIDTHYRTVADRGHRAIAGLSMGGLQTLNIALDDSADFAYVGVFSSGWFPDSIKEEQDTDVAKYRASGKPFRLFWVDAGKYDIALQNSHGCRLERRRHQCGGARERRLPRMAKLEGLSA